MRTVVSNVAEAVAKDLFAFGFLSLGIALLARKKNEKAEEALSKLLDEEKEGQ